MDLATFLEKMVASVPPMELFRVLSLSGWTDEARTIVDMLPTTNDASERELLYRWNRNPAMRPSLVTQIMWKRCRGDERFAKGAARLLIDEVKRRCCG